MSTFIGKNMLEISVNIVIGAAFLSALVRAML